MPSKNPSKQTFNSEWINRDELEALLSGLQEELLATDSTMRALFELAQKREQMRHKISFIRATLASPIDRILLTELR